MSQRNSFSSFGLLPLFCVALALQSCVTPKVRASDALVQDNPVQKVAVFGEGNVLWPRMGFGPKTPYFGISESRGGVEAAMPLVRAALEEKGYEVVACEPIGVGFCAPGTEERLVLSVIGQGDELVDDVNSNDTIRTDDPLYLYPYAIENPAIGQGMRTVFDGLEGAVTAGTGPTYTPDAEAVAAAAQATGADTICIVRVFGNVFSRGRKVGAFFLGGSVNDQTVTDCWLLDGETGEVHYAGAGFSLVRPNEMGRASIDGAFKLLPERGATLDPKNRL